MRHDDFGNPCPATLGEYRDLYAGHSPNSEAVAFLDEKIATCRGGRDAEVTGSHGNMRALLMPMLDAGERRGVEA